MTPATTPYTLLLRQCAPLLTPMTLMLAAFCGLLLLCFLLGRRRLVQQTDHFRNLAESTFEAIVLSRDGIICDCNELAEEMSGYSRAELLGRSLFDLLDPSFHQLIREHVASGYDQPYEIAGIRKDGCRVLLEARGKSFRSSGHLMRASCLRDITERKREESLLRKLSAAVEHSPASIVITDLQGAIEYANPAFTRMTGYGADEVRGENPRILKAGDQAAAFYAELWQTLLRGEEWRGEFHNKRKDGTLFWEMASISPILDTAGQITHFVAVKENITERKELQERLEQLAQFDMLTGLPNRRMLFDRLAQAVALAGRSGQRFALLFIDLDGFKRINDTHGHEAGDRVLKNVAARLSACLRISDTAGRIGGDEFIVLLGTLSRYRDAGQVAEKILAALRRPISLPDGARDCIGCSIGISIFPEDARDGDSLLAAADEVMYQMKQTGKGGYRFYQPPPVNGAAVAVASGGPA